MLLGYGYWAEQRLVTSAQAGAWKAPTMLGIKKVPGGFGRLFKAFGTAPSSMVQHG